MARRLTDYEWSQFMIDTQPLSMGLPPWGGVVDWSGMKVLVYIGPSGEVFTTDVTDDTQINWSSIPRYYDAASGSWWYHFPEELLKTISSDAAAVGQATVKAATEIASTVGETAGAVIKPTIDTLAPILIAALVVLGFVYIPKPQRS